MEPLLIVVDADTIVAQANVDDANHLRSTAIAHKLEALGARLIYPVTAITEAITVLQKKIDKQELAYGAAANFNHDDVEVTEVAASLPLAVKIFVSSSRNKKNTLFDCLVAAIAQNYKADAIFSFDKFYKKQGFKLASDL